MADSDVILLSGGTSVGVKDMAARIIDDIGSPGVIFHGVAMKPGKPMLSGAVRGIPIFGLPGHPAAVGVCCDVFVKPVLERLSGAVSRLPLPAGRWVKAKVSRNVASSAGRQEHVRVVIEARNDGLWAVPVLGKSGLISTLVKADGIFVIPLQAAGVEQGETVDVKLF
jgi:molybdopterin molybdotransferase